VSNAATSALTGLPHHRHETFLLRLCRWWRDLDLLLLDQGRTLEPGWFRSLSYTPTITGALQSGRPG
jgi:hypothetical protein